MTSTTVVSYDDFQAALRECSRAWHIEMKDTYRVESEDQHFQGFLDGMPDDYEWLGSWLHFIRELRGRGVVVERARIVSVPHADYTRWGLVVADRLTAAGEDIRYVDRDKLRDIQFPPEDFWLLDDNQLILSTFSEDGRKGGFARTNDPDSIDTCRAVRDQVWARAVPFQEYLGVHLDGAGS